MDNFLNTHKKQATFKIIMWLAILGIVVALVLLGVFSVFDIISQSVVS